MLVCSVFFVLLLSTVALADWTAVNDNLEIDYQTYQLQIFVTGKDKNRFKKQAQDIVFEYVKTLTFGEDAKKITDVFKARPTLEAKILNAVIKQTQRENRTETNMDKAGWSSYYYFDLNLLKSIAPELNFPTP